MHSLTKFIKLIRKYLTHFSMFYHILIIRSYCNTYPPMKKKRTSFSCLNTFKILIKGFLYTKGSFQYFRDAKCTLDCQHTSLTHIYTVPS